MLIIPIKLRKIKNLTFICLEVRFHLPKQVVLKICIKFTTSIKNPFILIKYKQLSTNLPSKRNLNKSISADIFLCNSLIIKPKESLLSKKYNQSKLKVKKAEPLHTYLKNIRLNLCVKHQLYKKNLLT